jgi:hypothetical protein
MVVTSMVGPTGATVEASPEPDAELAPIIFVVAARLEGLVEEASSRTAVVFGSVCAESWLISIHPPSRFSTTRTWFGIPLTITTVQPYCDGGRVTDAISSSSSVSEVSNEGKKMGRKLNRSEYVGDLLSWWVSV